MPFKTISNPQGKGFRVKNTKAGKIGKDVFKFRKNANIQVKNRQRFLKMIQKKL